MDKTLDFVKKHGCLSFLMAIILVILITIVAVTACNNQLSPKTAIDSDCYTMAEQTLIYTNDYLNGSESAEDAYTSINIICTESKLSNYHTGEEYEISQKIKELKNALKSATLTDSAKSLVQSKSYDLRKEFNKVVSK